MNQESIIHRFLNGYCYALAYELSPLLDLPIELLFATRSDGKRVEDPLHVYLRVNDQDIFDIKGKRPFSKMVKDFEGIASLIKRHDHEVIRFEQELLDDRDDLFDLYSFDPAGLEKVDFQVLSYLDEAINSFSKQLAPVGVQCEDCCEP